MRPRIGRCALLVAAAAGCTFSLPTPDAGDALSCPDGECPSGWTCSAAKVCVPSGSASTGTGSSTGGSTTSAASSASGSSDGSSSSSSGNGATGTSSSSSGSSTGSSSGASSSSSGFPAGAACVHDDDCQSDICLGNCCTAQCASDPSYPMCAATCDDSGACDYPSVACVPGGCAVNAAAQDVLTVPLYCNAGSCPPASSQNQVTCSSQTDPVCDIDAGACTPCTASGASVCPGSSCCQTNGQCGACSGQCGNAGASCSASNGCCSGLQCCALSLGGLEQCAAPSDCAL